MCAVRAVTFMCDFCAVCHVYRVSDTLYPFFPLFFIFFIPSISVEFFLVLLFVFILEEQFVENRNFY